VLNKNITGLDLEIKADLMVFIKVTTLLESSIPINIEECCPRYDLNSGVPIADGNLWLTLQ
jgi:hypothetical protein